MNKYLKLKTTWVVLFLLFMFLSKPNPTEFRNMIAGRFGITPKDARTDLSTGQTHNLLLFSIYEATINGYHHTYIAFIFNIVEI